MGPLLACGTRNQTKALFVSSWRPSPVGWRPSLSVALEARGGCDGGAQTEGVSIGFVSFSIERALPDSASISCLNKQCKVSHEHCKLQSVKNILTCSTQPAQSNPAQARRRNDLVVMHDHAACQSRSMADAPYPGAMAPANADEFMRFSRFV